MELIRWCNLLTEIEKTIEQNIESGACVVIHILYLI